MPLNDIEKIRQELLCTREAKYILDMPADIPIEFVADIDKIQKSMSASYLSEEELIDIAKTLRTSRLVKKFLMEKSQAYRIIEKRCTNLDI